MSTTKIEWTDTTWNVTSGCTRASAGCDNCYAVRQTKRLAKIEKTRAKYEGLVNEGKNHFNGVVRCHESELLKPFSWSKPRMVFVNSMSDLFHKDVPFEFIDQVFSVMALCPDHTFQVLTKRPERMAEYLSNEDTSARIWTQMGKIDERWYDLEWVRDEGHEVVLPTPGNVWLGTSVEDQEAADERIPYLLQCPAAVRFLSCEPLLGDIKFDYVPGLYEGDGHDMPWMKDDTLHWVIAGGESGPGARPCNVDWIRSIVQQCKDAQVPCFVKQLGSKPFDPEAAYHFNDYLKLKDRKGGDMSEFPEDLRVREMPLGSPSGVTGVKV